MNNKTLQRLREARCTVQRKTRLTFTNQRRRFLILASESNVLRRTRGHIVGRVTVKLLRQKVQGARADRVQRLFEEGPSAGQLLAGHVGVGLAPLFPHPVPHARHLHLQPSRTPPWPVRKPHTEASCGTGTTKKERKKKGMLSSPWQK